jgi:nucleotide-binding universal stress UspA family protein
MLESMKVLLGYDGSDCANAAIDDLARAGLPPHTEVRALTYIDIGVHLSEWPHSPARVQQDVERTIKESEQVATRAAQKLHAQYRGWQVHAEALSGSPSRGLVDEAERWGAELIVVGSHGRSAMGRAFLGSCSQMVLTHATGSVRVSRSGRHPAGEAPRLVLATDGSKDAIRAVQTVANRAWPAGTVVHVVGVLDLWLATAALPTPVGVSYAGDAGAYNLMPLDVAPPQEVLGEKWLREAIRTAVDVLTQAGLAVKQVFREGGAKHQIIEEAEAVGADCIFLGSRGMNRVERFMMGGVSTAVAARAHCSVEVVR